MPNSRIHAPDIGLFNRAIALVPTTQLKLLDEHSEHLEPLERLELLERLNR